MKATIVINIIQENPSGKLESGEVYFVSLRKVVTRRNFAHTILSQVDVTTFPLIASKKEVDLALKQYRIQSSSKITIQFATYHGTFGLIFATAKQALIFLKDGYLTSLHVSFLYHPLRRYIITYIIHRKSSWESQIQSMPNKSSSCPFNH